MVVVYTGLGKQDGPSVGCKMDGSGVEVGWHSWHLSSIIFVPFYPPANNLYLYEGTCANNPSRVNVCAFKIRRAKPKTVDFTPMFKKIIEHLNACFWLVWGSLNGGIVCFRRNVILFWRDIYVTN